jgi:BSD domain
VGNTFWRCPSFAIGSHLEINMDGEGQLVAMQQEGDGGPSEIDENVMSAIEKIDDTIDQALGSAADKMWSFASAFSVGVSSVVKDAPASISSNILPLDTFSRSLTEQLSNLGPDENALERLKLAARSAAETVQRKASAVEVALRTSAAEALPPLLEASNIVDDALGENVVANQGDVAGDAERVGIDAKDAGKIDIKPPKEKENTNVYAPRGYVREDLNVNDELARAAETIQNSFVGQTVGGLFGSLWGDTQSEDDDDYDAPSLIQEVPVTRLQRRVVELETNPDTYCQPAADLNAFEIWSKDFNLESHEKDCISLLSRHEPIATLYERVVPNVIEEDIFWKRYFYALHAIHQEEDERRKLLQRAVGSANAGPEPETAWDDDWDNDDDPESSPLRTSADKIQDVLQTEEKGHVPIAANSVNRLVDDSTDCSAQDISDKKVPSEIPEACSELVTDIVTKSRSDFSIPEPAAQPPALPEQALGVSLSRQLNPADITNGEGNLQSLSEKPADLKVSADANEEDDDWE